MAINWFTAFAQIINFFVLVWLLRRFLYQPILGVMAERERDVTQRLQAAEQQRAAATLEKQKYEESQAGLTRNRDALQRQAEAEVGVRRAELTATAEADVKALREKWQVELGQAQDVLRRRLAATAQRELFSLARHMLADLAEIGLDGLLAKVLMKRLHQLPATEQQQITARLGDGATRAVVRSALPLPDDARAEVMRGLGLGGLGETGTARITFEVAPELVSGIELLVDSHKVSWTVAGYLADLEAKVAQVLEQERHEIH